MYSYFRKFLTGLTVPQQYVGVSLDDFESPLSVFLSVSGSDPVLDVSHAHLLLGYRPLIIAVVCEPENNFFSTSDTVELYFTYQTFGRDKDNHDAATIRSSYLARLELRRVMLKEFAGHKVVYYEGLYGEHKFIRPFHQFFNNLREKLRHDHPGNVRLPGNLYDQVRIAYAVPRIIALITVSDGERMNMFPTDLHGPCANEHYFTSLRRGGKANDQVEQQGRLALSSVPVEELRTVHALGKNHMKDMGVLGQFPQITGRSMVFDIPLPSFALLYRELERIDSFDAGIHRIHFYRVVNTRKVREGRTLAHIHQYYAQSRIDNKLPLNMLFR